MTKLPLSNSSLGRLVQEFGGAMVKAPAKEFAKQQWAEGCWRGLEKAKQIVSSPCIEIIDWWHATNSLRGQGKVRTVTWVEQQKDRLWAGQLRPLLHQVRQVCPRAQPLLI